MEQTIEQLRRLKPFIFRYKILLLITTITSILYAFFSIFASISVRYLTDLAIDQKMKEFTIIGYVVFGLAIFYAIVHYTRQYATSRLNMLIIRDLKNQTIKHVQRLPLNYMEKHHSGDVVSRLNHDTTEIKNLIGNLFELLYQPIVFIVAFTYLFIISPKLLLANIILIPISAIVFNKIAKPIQKKAKSLMETHAEINAITQDVLNGAQVMKAYQLDEVLYKKYQSKVNDTVKKGMEIQLIRCFLTPIFLILRFIPQLVCPLYGGYLALNGEITIGSLLGANIIIWSLFLPIESMLNLLQQVRTGIPAVSRIGEILDHPIEKYGLVNTSIDNGNIPIFFQDVVFNYDNSYLILDHVDFLLKENKVTALVGPSGSGKSTILKLICGFYENQAGTIKLFGEDIKSIDVSSIRSQISFVSQDAYLFPTTVENNIRYGKLDASLDEIIDAAKRANAHDFIMKLPNGYDTLIGQEGIKLSGGEKQRISLARALLKNTPILLLDEPTASLDAHSERMVLDALKELMKNKTVLIIAHRYSTIKDAFEILVLDQGKIVERGSHKTLISSNGTYQKLYQNQINNEEGDQIV